jgi:coatomer subunit epsilon
MDGADELFELRNLFALGNYQGAINEAEQRASSTGGSPLDTERRAVMYRSFIAQGKPAVVLGELGSPDGLPAALRAVGLLAAFMLAKQAEGDMRAQQEAQVLGMLKDFLESSEASSDESGTVQVVAATIYSLGGDLQAAMRSVYSTETLEAKASLCQIFLAVNRPDAAERELRAMQRADDLATWTQLCVAAVACANPSSDAEALSEAQQIYQELADKFGATAKLLNGLAVCQTLQGDYVNSERSLSQALEKDPRNGDTLVNIVANSAQHGKATDFVERQLRMLETEAPSHPWLQKRRSAIEALDAAAAKYSAATE